VFTAPRLLHYLVARRAKTHRSDAWCTIGGVLVTPSLVALAATAGDASTDPTPWYESQLAGVVAGAVLGLIGAWLSNRSARELAKDQLSFESQQAEARRKDDRLEARRDARNEAVVHFIRNLDAADTAVRMYADEYYLMPGEDISGNGLPRGGPPDLRLESAITEFYLLMPDDVVKAAETVRDQHYRWAYGTAVDVSAQERPGEPLREDWVDEAAYQAAIRAFHEKARAVLGND